MSKCISRCLMFDEDQSLVTPRINIHFPEFESPSLKRHKVTPDNKNNKEHRFSANFFDLFEEMSQKNGSAKHKLEDEDSNFNYFEENYGRLVSDSFGTSSSTDMMDGKIVNIVSPHPSIFLSPKKKTNRKSIISPTSSTDEYYESTNKELLKICKVLFHYNHIGGEFPEETSIMSKYQVIGDIDRGSFSAVYKVKDKTAPDKQYALKKFNKQFVSFNERKVMLHEVEMMSKTFQHPHDGMKHVVRCFLAWQEDSCIHMLMELSTNGSLKDLVEKCLAERVRIPDSTLWRVVSDLSSGLHCIHSSGVVHLDIKPSNVLISSDGTLKIGDFGLAAPVGSNDFDREGDKRYMALELLNESVRLPSADIFSLGITLYELSLVCDSEVPVMQVPGEGPAWQALRNGQYSLPTGRPSAFVQLLHSTMAPSAEQRVTAQDILRGLPTETITMASEGGDPMLLSVKPRRSVEYTPQMNRSPSFDALNMAV